MTKILIISTILIVVFTGVVVTAVVTEQSRPEEKEFNGYILWLREAVVFTDIAKFNEGENFPTLGNLTWVEQNDIVASLYDKSQTLIDAEHDFDDTRIIKVRFNGLYQEGGQYGHLGKYSSAVTVTDVISYSNVIEN